MDWDCLAYQMRYLLKYGILYHRFQLAHNEMSTGLMKHLLTLQVTTWLVFLLEKAMKGQQLLEGRKQHRMERFGYKKTSTKTRMKSQSNNLNHRNKEGRKQRNWRMIKISQSEEKIIKQVDEVKNIRVDLSLYNFDIFYQLSLPTQVYYNRYADENGI